MSNTKTSNTSSDIRSRILRTLPILFLLSFAINTLMMAGPIFMLQVYDRVIPSQSLPTLSGLLGLVAILFLFLGLFEFLRSRLVSRIAFFVDTRAGQVNGADRQHLSLQTIGGLKKSEGPASKIRDFLNGGAVEAFLDTLFVPVYIFCLWSLHPLLAAVSFGGAVGVGLLTLLNNYLSRPLLAESGKMSNNTKDIEGQLEAHAREISSMGMASTLLNGLNESHNQALSVRQRLLSKSQFFKSISKGARPMIHACMLAAGAYLVIGGGLTAGAMIAASVIAGRMLQPIDQSINHWPGYVAARKAFTQLNQKPDEEGGAESRSLPDPTGRLTVNTVTLLDKEKMASGSVLPVLRDIDFSLQAGDGLCIAGPSGSGKSVLIDLLIGAQKADRGDVRFDSAKLEQWNLNELGKHIGYLAQNSKLMPGTIADNISRFSEPDSMDEVVRATRLLGAHEKILALPEGYNTKVGPTCDKIPNGLVQQICIARAIFRSPKILILDDPAVHLDHEGEKALINCIHQMRLNGSTVIASTHRQSMTQVLNRLLVLNKGMQVRFEETAKAPVNNAGQTPVRLAA